MIFVYYIWFATLLGLLSNVLGYVRLSSRSTKQLITSSDSDNAILLDPSNADGFLSPILRVRTPGTDNSTLVRNHLTSVFSESWSVLNDQFYSDTPIGNVSFTNILATRDPQGSDPATIGRLVLAAHYDSKLHPEGFLGATDSAVPCALIMHVINAIDSKLDDKWGKASMSRRNGKRGSSGSTKNPGKRPSVGLQVIFFDGEEAILEWTDSDSIYGARNLAKSMAVQTAVPRSGSSAGQRSSLIDSIDALVLLDLLGAPSPVIPSYFKETDWLHRKLSSIEDRLDRMGLLRGTYNQKIFRRPPMFQYGGLIGDDHLPFLQRGTPVLHLIPIQFPDVWHKITDDAEHLDMNVVHDWADILLVFVAEYLELGLEDLDRDL